MLLKSEILRRIEEGEVDLVFRRWASPRVVDGTRLRTARGVVEIVSIEPVNLSSITPREAGRAGAGSLESLLAELRSRAGQVYRIRVRHAGADPRIALRAASDLGADEIERLRGRLEGFDQRAPRPWTRAVLQMIGTRPGVVARELAAERGEETAPFKVRVRKLKELGLTESLEVGYRLSPRGKALLKRLRDG